VLASGTTLVPVVAQNRLATGETEAEIPASKVLNGSDGKTCLVYVLTV
jgi:hypothetical protein